MVKHIDKIKEKKGIQIKKINYLLPFKENDIFFSVGVGYNEHIYDVIEDSKKKF